MSTVAEEPGDWTPNVDQDVFDNLAEVIRSQDAVLLGRGTYDYWVDYWPTSQVQPFADFINATTKHVFTTTTPAAPWKNTQVVDGPAVAYVADLKRQPCGAIGIHGSITLAQTLLTAGLVDELRLVMAPVLAGHGRRLFGALSAARRLHLSDEKRSPAGNLLLAYQGS